MPKSIEDIIIGVLDEKLSDGTIHKVVEEKINSIISKVIDDSFGWSSPAYKMIKDKVTDLMCKSIENSNFDDYVVKITEVLNGAFKNSSLEDYRNITTSLNELLSSGTGSKILEKVTMTDIINKYEEFLQEYYSTMKDSFDSDDIQEDCEYPHGYAYLDYQVEIYDLSDRFSSYTEYDVILTNTFEEEETSFTFKLKRNRWDSNGTFYVSFNNDYRLSDIKHLESFSVYLLKLKKNMCHIDFNDEGDKTIDGQVCIEFEE